MKEIPSVQIGKNGITSQTHEFLKSNFKKHQNVKVIFLKSFSRDRNKNKENCESILEELGKNYTFRLLGFTAFIKKWRKPMR